MMRCRPGIVQKTEFGTVPAQRCNAIGRRRRASTRLWRCTASGTRRPGVKRARDTSARCQPGIDLPLRLVLGDAVTLLQTAGELLSPALDHVKVVVGELSPLPPNLALELLPVAFDAVPIHRLAPPEDGSVKRKPAAPRVGSGYG